MRSKFVFPDTFALLKNLFFYFFIFHLAGCAFSKNYSPDKKYSREELQQDFTLLRNIMEKKHPSLYWYTSKDSMNMYFDEGFKDIKDSMTELQFGWKIIAPLTNKIHCGHTSFSMSSGWEHFIRNRRIPSFPLHMKIWDDTMVVTENLNSKDSVIKNGTIITAINGIRNHEMLQNMFGYLAQDGYSDNVNFIRLSLNFPYFHRNIFGLYSSYSVQYLDSTGTEKNAIIPYYNPAADTLDKNKKMPRFEEPKHHHKAKFKNIRSLKIDTSGNLAVMRLYSFSKGHLQNFFKHSFKKIKKSGSQNLVIDIRNNGGGDINNFVSLASYIKNTSFRVADTAASIAKNFRPYSKYIKADFFDKPALLFLTKKKSENRYHFGYWERHVIKPRRNYHFNGNVYVLINGLTFSASALFCNSVKGQSNVTLVGEETGGGWHGNSGIMIPEIILPNTRLRVRLPFFRLVQFNHVPKNGTGILPDIVVKPTLNDVRKNFDRKMEVVKDIIGLKNDSTKSYHVHH